MSASLELYAFAGFNGIWIKISEYRPIECKGAAHLQPDADTDPRKRSLREVLDGDIYHFLHRKNKIDDIAHPLCDIDDVDIFARPAITSSFDCRLVGSFRSAKRQRQSLFHDFGTQNFHQGLEIRPDKTSGNFLCFETVISSVPQSLGFGKSLAPPLCQFRRGGPSSRSTGRSLVCAVSISGDFAGFSSDETSRGSAS
ncbi:hypothetical protein BBAD15_g10783 [Beauveria bassiana D1-5]|uniref:Uncharacterized protein n=1 Tax=Beauveria bassiana D1-5 TaxID=1245745 RepID=A0A0A2V924_BEABA|nr:hypothetical protein BBAD15_g10783 [Beauveria bassiana D1-5]